MLQKHSLAKRTLTPGHPLLLVCWACLSSSNPPLTLNQHPARRHEDPKDIVKQHPQSNDKPVVCSTTPQCEAEAEHLHPGDSQIALPKSPSMTRSSDARLRSTKWIKNFTTRRSIMRLNGTSATFEVIMMASLMLWNLLTPARTVARRTNHTAPCHHMGTLTNTKPASSARP